MAFVVTPPQTVFDVVVVGGGAGGASAALRLVELGLSVAVLERGADVTPLPVRQEEQDIRLWTAGAADRANVWSEDPNVPFVTEGNRLGGSTNVFASNALRFHAEDFHRRSLLGEIAGASLADWPLSYDELAPHYDAIEREMGVAGGLAENPFEPARSGPTPMPPVPLDEAGRQFHKAARSLGWHPYGIPTVTGAGAGRNACVPCGHCAAHICTYGARWSARDFLVLAKARGRLHIELTAQVTRVLVSDDGDRVIGVEHAHTDGSLRSVRARAVVLAANSVQTPRLLLSSHTRGHEAGLCNESGEVGRNLTMHVHDPILVGGYLPTGAPTTATPGSTIAIQDFYTNPHGVGVTLEPRAFGSRPVWDLNTAQDPEKAPMLAAGDGEAYARRFETNVVITNIIEDLPQPDNRVTLSSTRRDRLGLAIPEVRYRPHAHDLAVGAYAAGKAEELLGAVGAKGIFRVNWGAGRYHVFGSVRMGSDPMRSVVDGHGRAHRLANLYVTDASVFPTSAGVNPVLTICALARRSAEHLAAAMQRRDL